MYGLVKDAIHKRTENADTINAVGITVENVKFLLQPPRILL